MQNTKNCIVMAFWSWNFPLEKLQNVDIKLVIWTINSRLQKLGFKCLKQSAKNDKFRQT
jgi:hypothetical protein